MKKLNFVALVALLTVGLTSCVIRKPVIEPYVTTILTCSATPNNRFHDFSRGLTLTVTSEASDDEIFDGSEIGTNNVNRKGESYYRFTPTITEFVEETMSTFIRSTGIALGRDRVNDYNLNVKVKEFKFVYGPQNSRATIVMDYTLKNTDNEIILQQTTRGRYSATNKNITAETIIDEAYSRALKSMDWVGIADALKVHRRAEQEKQRQVEGNGNTALEHTVIRWYIISSPAGADVSWRVVSSTPDVKNTNTSYVGTTPYETTESFDIRGLKFENSGNVQIEVTCEKPGYLPQRRRFNLRQAIEQREISAKFNLVKEE